MNNNKLILDTDDFKSYLKDIDDLSYLLDSFHNIKVEEASNYIYEMVYFKEKFKYLLRQNVDPLLQSKMQEIYKRLESILNSFSDETLEKIYKNHIYATHTPYFDKELNREKEYTTKAIKNRINKFNIKMVYFVCTITIAVIISIFGITYISLYLILLVILAYIVYRYTKLYTYSLSYEVVQLIEESQNDIRVRGSIPDKLDRGYILMNDIENYVIKRNLDKEIINQLGRWNNDISDCLLSNKDYMKIYETFVYVELLYESIVTGKYDGSNFKRFYENI